MKSAASRSSVKAGGGKGERIAGAVILFMLAAIVGAYAVQFWSTEELTLNAAGPQYGMPSSHALPDPALAGWTPPTDIMRYVPENLYLKVNGRADFFLEHGATGLLFGSYRHRRDNDRAVDVYWYTMSTAAGAREVYLAERPPNITPLAFGEEGYASGGAVFFRSNVDYVQVLPISFDEDSKEAARAIAKCVADMISGAAG